VVRLAAEGAAVLVEAARHHDLGAALPFLDELRGHFRRMLEVAVHHHDGAPARMAQPGTQCRLMAEIAGERDVSGSPDCALRSRGSPSMSRRSSHRRRR